MLLGTGEGRGWRLHNLAENKASAGAGNTSVLQSTCTGGMDLIWIKRENGLLAMSIQEAVSELFN